MSDARVGSEQHGNVGIEIPNARSISLFERDAREDSNSAHEAGPCSLADANSGGDAGTDIMILRWLRRGR